ncbi:hypothetical protein ACTVH1_18260 [Gluconobacter cerinus]
MDEAHKSRLREQAVQVCSCLGALMEVGVAVHVLDRLEPTDIIAPGLIVAGAPGGVSGRFGLYAFYGVQGGWEAVPPLTPIKGDMLLKKLAGHTAAFNALSVSTPGADVSVVRDIWLQALGDVLHP